MNYAGRSNWLLECQNFFCIIAYHIRDSHAVILMVQIKLFSDLYLPKFLDTLAKLFFLLIYHKSHDYFTSRFIIFQVVGEQLT